MRGGKRKMDETRNELLHILKQGKNNFENEKMRLLNIDMLLDRFKYDLEDQLQHLEYKNQDLKENLKLIEEIKKELKLDEMFNR